MSNKEQTAGIVRIGGRDVKGNTSLRHALIKMKGVNFPFANAICTVMDLNPKNKIGKFSKDQIKEIEEVAKNPKKNNIPDWILNRRRDPETGENKHLIGADLELQEKFDIRKMKKMKSYKGIRHAHGLPVRGQKTKGTFRSKGSTVGVIKKKQLPEKSDRKRSGRK